MGWSNGIERDRSSHWEMKSEDSDSGIIPIHTFFVSFDEFIQIRTLAPRAFQNIFGERTFDRKINLACSSSNLDGLQ